MKAGLRPPVQLRATRRPFRKTAEAKRPLLENFACIATSRLRNAFQIMQFRIG